MRRRRSPFSLAFSSFLVTALLIAEAPFDGQADGFDRSGNAIYSADPVAVSTKLLASTASTMCNCLAGAGVRIGVGQGTGQHAGLGRPLTVPAHTQPPHCVTRPPPSLLSRAVRTSCGCAESLRGCEGAHVQRGLGGPKAVQPSSP